MNYGGKIYTLRKEKNITQEKLAKQIGISRTALAHYEKSRREPDYEVLCRLADYFNVSVDYILCRSDNKRVNFSRKLPLLKEITWKTVDLAKNSNNEVENTFESYIEVASHIKADFALKIENNSMMWAGINKNDIALIKIDYNPPPGKIVAVTGKENSPGGLKFYVLKNDKVYLTAGNPKYKDIQLPYNCSSEKCSIVGLVIKILKRPPTYQEYKNFLFEKTTEDENWQKAKEKSASYGLDGEKINMLLDIASKLKQLDEN